MSAKAFLKKKKHFLFEKAKIKASFGNSNTKIDSSFGDPGNNFSNSASPLVAIIRSLCVFGLHASPYKKTHKCCKAFYFIHTMAVLTALHYWSFLYLSYFFRKAGSWKLFNQAMIIWTSAATYDVFLWQKNNIALFISLFYKDQLFELSKTQRQTFSRRVRILNAGVWIYLALWVLTFLAIPTKKLPKEHFTATFYELIANRTSVTFQKYLIQLNDGLLCFLVEGNLTFCVMFYVVALRGCFLWFKVFERTILTYSKTCYTVDMNYIQKMYDALARRVQNIDDAFSMSVLFWYFMVTVTLCIRVIAILSEDSKKDVDIQGFLTIGFGLSRGTFVILLGISFGAQYLIDTAQLVVLKIDKCLENRTDFASHQTYAVLLRKAEITPILVTLWKFCPIGKPFLMSCVQTMTTYVIICLQMSNKVAL